MDLRLSLNNGNFSGNFWFSYEEVFNFLKPETVNGYVPRLNGVEVSVYVPDNLIVENGAGEMLYGALEKVMYRFPYSDDKRSLFMVKRKIRLRMNTKGVPIACDVIDEGYCDRGRAFGNYRVDL
ncbi:MAG: hypothetical protein ISS01_00030 [Nanoarchaeota archaeon]|nr:hypothetical protein [Nanoarchaeota archaeon]